MRRGKERKGGKRKRRWKWKWMMDTVSVWDWGWYGWYERGTRSLLICTLYTKIVF